MALLRKRLADRGEDSRQVVIAFKKFFESEEGKLVFTEIVNRYGFMDEMSGVTDDKVLGAHNVIKYILKQANMNMAQFEKLLKGEL